MSHHYVIVGGGPTAAAAVEGIRANDPEGSILLMSRENYPPYQRPPLSKDLWFGKSTKEQLPIHDEAFYRDHRVELVLRRDVVELDPETHTIWDERGSAFEYRKLLLATGAKPRLLGVEGGHIEGVRYYRTLEDYDLLQARLPRLQHVLVVGGGFIGLEMAAALRHAGKEVTFVYPHQYPLANHLPRDLGLHVADYYRQKGVETVSDDRIVSFEEAAGLIHARTAQGNTITTQLVLAGVGAVPNAELAEAAGLAVREGIEVDEFARTTHPDVYAAGDVAEYPDLTLGERRRVEHWDHALRHGKAAGANMAGAELPYTALPMFYSDFFDIGWEAVGDLDSSLDVVTQWHDPLREGVLFYLRDDQIRGVLLWNAWNKVDWARDLIRKHKPLTDDVRAEAVASAT